MIQWFYNNNNIIIIIIYINKNNVNNNKNSVIKTLENISSFSTCISTEVCFSKLCDLKHRHGNHFK